MSKILCIIDGMTDPGFRVADYPNLSRMYLAKHIDTTKGHEPESLGCILRLLGVEKVPEYLRGYTEALGYGIPVNTNDLILRGSWFALDESGRITVPVPAPETLHGIENCRYYHLEQYKSLLVFPGMATFVSDLITHPPYACGGLLAEQLQPDGCIAVEKLFQSQLTKERCLVPWGQSVSRSMPPFSQKAAVISGTPIVKGIARLLDMGYISVPGATGDVDTDLAAKVFATIDAAKRYPFVLLHINGADEAAHRKSEAEKKAFLHKVDELVIPLLLRSWHEVYVTGDHGTDPGSGTHVAQLQPVFSNVPVSVSIKKTDKDKSANVPRQASMKEDQWRAWAIQQLRKKADEVSRMPTKADFEPIEKIRIKNALGPWPRALEAAGLKEPKEKKTANRR